MTDQTEQVPVTVEDFTAQACIARLEKLAAAKPLRLCASEGGMAQPEWLDLHGLVLLTRDELREILIHLRRAGGDGNG